ncbi:hypothetical protein FB451DRAFT_660110 [Mycena latifolia]|nr:hypothetical protein FB451DRAFT_660110 [Mycena latifolia]
MACAAHSATRTTRGLRTTRLERTQLERATSGCAIPSTPADAEQSTQPVHARAPAVAYIASPSASGHCTSVGPRAVRCKAWSVMRAPHAVAAAQMTSSAARVTPRVSPRDVCVEVRRLLSASHACSAGCASLVGACPPIREGRCGNWMGSRASCPHSPFPRRSRAAPPCPAQSALESLGAQGRREPCAHSRREQRAWWLRQHILVSFRPAGGRRCGSATSGARCWCVLEPRCLRGRID